MIETLSRRLGPRAAATIDRLGALVVVAAVATAWVVEIGPTRGRAEALAARRAETGRLADDASALATSRDDLDAALARVAQVRDRLDDALPRRREELATLQWIAETAGHAGLGAERLDPVGADGDDRFESVAVRVSGGGTFAAVTRFLDELAAGRRALRIGSVTVEGREPALHCEVTIHLLRRTADDRKDDPDDGDDEGPRDLARPVAGEGGRDV